jgi:membrane-associated protease RseP (regulator of RpoE activity)
MSVALYTLGVLLFAVGVAVSIALHELAHLVLAKGYGARATQYFVGFGRTLWSTRRGETEYGLKAVPLGGFVKIVGMLPPGPDGLQGRPRTSSTGIFSQLVSDARRAEYEHADPDDPRLFYKLPWWKKLVVMGGGATTNVLIAFLLFAGIFGLHGTEEPTTTVKVVAQCVVPASQAGRSCKPGDPVSPAARAGLQPGDRILSFNGSAIHGWPDLVRLIRANDNGRAVIVYVRDGERRTTTTTTTVRTDRAIDSSGRVQPGYVKAGFLGVVSTTTLQRHGLLFTADQMGSMTWSTVTALGQLPVKVWGVAKAVAGAEPRDPNSPVSVVGAGRVAGEITSDSANPMGDRIVFLLSLLAGLNLFIGMFNFVPLLPLDGGHMAGALYEGIRRGVARVLRRPDPGFVDVAKLLPVAYVVAGLLLVMTLVLVAGDIVAPVSVG